MDENEWLAERFEEHRARLRAVAVLSDHADK